MSATVIKKGKRPSEDFNAEKLRASLYAACLSSKSPDGLAHNLAAQVAQEVEIWSNQKSDVTTTDIRTQAGRFLEKKHPDAAYLYKHHKKMM